jgi:hypothetical protein
MGGRPTVDSALHRLEKRGEIRRVIRGIYDYPSFSKFLGQTLSPDIDQVARALAEVPLAYLAQRSNGLELPRAFHSGSCPRRLSFGRSR